MKPKKQTASPDPRLTKQIPTPDTRMTPKEKEALADQVEELEGPDRREKRGSEPLEKRESGVARS